MWFLPRKKGYNLKFMIEDKPWVFANHDESFQFRKSTYILQKYFQGLGKIKYQTMFYKKNRIYFFNNCLVSTYFRKM